MKAWMRSVLGFAGIARTAPRRPRVGPARRVNPVESLERREVLSGAGVPLATFSSAVAAKGDVAKVVIPFDAGELASDRAQSILIGVYAKPTAGSTLVPNITGVGNASGRLNRADIPQRGPASAAKALYITSVPLGTGQAQNLTVNVAGQNGKTGGFDLEVFLPGDANGDSMVDAVDLAILQGVYGTAEGEANFNAAADFNADGHVGCIDRMIVELNQGARAVYTPPVVQVPTTPPVTTPPVTTPPATTPPATTSPFGPTLEIPAPASPTPVVAAQAVVAAPAVVAPAATPQTAPMVVASLQAAPTANPAPAQAGASVPVYAVPAPAGYVATNAAPVVVYGQPAAVAPDGTTTPPASGNAAATPAVAYYYGQPVVQAPAFSPAISNQSPAQPVVLYGYGQPVAAMPGAPAPVVVYYGQPTAAGQPARA